MIGRLFGRRSAAADASPDPRRPGVTRVLMVCMGNICRSPTAAGVLTARLREAGLHRTVHVDSAGMIDHHRGSPADPRALKHAAARGYDLGAHRARPVEPGDFVRFQWLLAMDEENLAWLRKRAPASGDAPGPRIGLLLDHAPEARVREVPDPYYGPPAGFEHVLDLIEQGCAGFVRRLQAERRDQALS